jgi:hypothetical protein
MLRRIVFKRRTIIFFVALLGGYIGSRLVYSQDTKPPDVAAPTAAAPETTPTAAATPTSIPDYFDAHATDTNGDGKIDDKDEPKWPDPTGGAAGVWANPGYTTDSTGKAIGGELPSSLSSTDLYDRVAHNLFSINFVWVLICGFLVMFMQAGFALVEGGLCRAKNSSHTFAMNFTCMDSRSVGVTGTTVPLDQGGMRRSDLEHRF